jgi:hypothetical protein
VHGDKEVPGRSLAPDAIDDHGIMTMVVSGVRHEDNGSRLLQG